MFGWTRTEECLTFFVLWADSFAFPDRTASEAYSFRRLRLQRRRDEETPPRTSMPGLRTGRTWCASLAIDGDRSRQQSILEDARTAVRDREETRSIRRHCRRSSHRRNARRAAHLSHRSAACARNTGSSPSQSQRWSSRTPVAVMRDVVRRTG